MGSSAQTERFLVKLTDPVNLPENLVARVRVVKEVIPSAVALPQSCILADETLQHFWVMKLINDSTAVKVTITPGITQDGHVQVTSPVLLPADRFLSSGNYGLADTASVKIINSGLNE
jgi:multidrug efflux pump subunit AcrA (membrane-fusion protein)